MHIEQYYLACLSHMSYMITDDETKTAAIVDPQRDVEVYLSDAAAGGFAIRHVFLTHFHADFLAGHLELREKTGAAIYLGRRGDTEYPVTHVQHGDRVEFGDVRMQILETPGHTPESISILVFDLGKSADEPFAVMTGDTLFIGDVGRPDLLASIGVTSDQLAEMLYQSLREKLIVLPDETLLYPAHGAGSMCGKNLSTDKVSTIGEQKRFNYALQPMSLNEFKDIVTQDQPETPGYFAHDAMLNRQEHLSLDASMAKSLHPLGVDDLLLFQARGAQVVDTRDPIDFEGAHLAGSVNVGINGKFATWCGTILRQDRPIVVIADRGREEEAVRRLGRIGFDNVVGYLRDGMDALADRPELIGRIARITAVTLSEHAAAADPPLVLDVRGEKEWAAGHIPGSLNIPLNHLSERMADLPAAGAIVVHCEAGYRSAIGASLLQAGGRQGVVDLVGGFKAWIASKLPVE